MERRRHGAGETAATVRVRLDGANGRGHTTGGGAPDTRKGDTVGIRMEARTAERERRKDGGGERHGSEGRLRESRMKREERTAQ